MDIADTSSASAQLAQRNGDMVRDAFFYTQPIKFLITENMHD
jgi:hypothetical protein